MRKSLILLFVMFTLFFSCTEEKESNYYLGKGITIPGRKISQEEVKGVYLLNPSSLSTLKNKYLTDNHYLYIFGDVNKVDKRCFFFKNAPDWNFDVKNKSEKELGYMYGNWAVPDDGYIQEKGDTLYNVTLRFPVQKFFNKEGTTITNYAILEKDNKLVLADTYIANDSKRYVIYDKVKEITPEMELQLKQEWDSFFRVDYPDKNLDSVKIWW